MTRTDSSRVFRDRLALWLILILALVLRVWGLGEKNLWLDESTSWQLAVSSLADLIRSAAGDIHPPLYYLILKGWIGVFGDSLAGLRSLSVVSSMVAAYLMFRLARRGLPYVVACAALFWFAVSPHAIFFSQEARMYAAVTASVLGACLAYRHWVDSGFTSRIALAGYAVSVALSLYLHYLTALVVVAIWLHVVVLTVGRATRTSSAAGARRVPWATWLLVHAAIVLAYLPWIGTAVAHVSRGQSWRQPVTLGQIPRYARDLLGGLLWGVYKPGFAGKAVGVLAASVIVAGLLRISMTAIRSFEQERDAFFALVALVPMFLGLALLPVTGHMDLSRYLPFAVPLVLLAAARGLSSFRVRPVVIAGALLAGGMATLPALGAYYQAPTKDSDARPIVAHLSGVARHGPGSAQDPIFVAPGYMTSVLRYVSRGDLVYREIRSGTDLWNTLGAATSPLHATWLVVDYRWPGFKDLGRDGRLSEEQVPSGWPGKMKLFRVRPASE